MGEVVIGGWSKGFALAIFIGALASVSAVAPDRSYWQLNLSGDSPAQVTLTEDPEIVVVSNSVHILQTATAQTNGEIKRLIYMRSTDGGNSFQPPIVIEEHPGLDFALGRMKRLAVSGEAVHIVSTRAPVWTGGGWYYVLDYYRSVNNGASFEARRTLDSGEAAWHIRMPHIAVSGNKVTIAYLVYPNWYTATSLKVLNSEDGGSHFSPGLVASSTTEGFDLHDVMREGDKVAVGVLASKGIPGSYAYTYRILVGASTDGGASWSVNQVCSTNSAGWPKADSLSDYDEKPDLAWTGDTLYATWTGLDTNDVRHVFVARSLDNGRTFESQVRLSGALAGTPQYGQASVAARGSYAYIVWNMPNTGIWMSRSADGGASWSAPKQIVDGGWWPRVAIEPSSPDGQQVHFLCTGGAYRYSGDGGETVSEGVHLTTAWSWWGSGGVKSMPWAIGPNSTIHTAFQGLQSPGANNDFDLYYRRYEPLAGVPNIGSQCLVLKSSNADYHYENMQVPVNPGLVFSNRFTFEMWMQPDTNCPFDSTLLMQSHPDHYLGAVRLQTHGWSNGRRPSFRMLTTNDIVSVWGGELLKDDAWHHLAVTYDADAGNDNLRLYVDGRFSAAATAKGPVRMTERTLFVGGAAGGTYNAFSGAVNELRLWNRALSEAELRVHTTSRLKASEPGLVAYYPLDGSTADLTGRNRDGVLMYKEYFTTYSAPVQPVITSVPMSSGMVGAPFLFEVVADWATGFSITAGSLPPGVTFDPALGIFSGTPAAPGGYDLTVQAANDFGTVKQNLRIAIQPNTGLVFRDDFNNRTNQGWQMIRDYYADGYYSFYPGGLRLRGYSGDTWAGANNAANMFTTPAPTDDFTVTLAVSKFVPGPINYVQLCLMAMENEDNYMRYSYGYASRPMVSLIRESARTPAGLDFSQDFGDRPFLLRLSRQGTMYRGFYSTNGVDFFPSHEPMFYGPAAPEKVAFWLGIDPAYTNTALIDAFDVKAGAQPFFTGPAFTSGILKKPFFWPCAGPRGCLFSAAGLPGGLVIDTALGTITGTPTVSGIFDVTVSASNHIGAATQILRIVIDDNEREYFREDFTGQFATGWNPLPSDTAYYTLTNGSQLSLRANNGDTWTWYNRGLNLFTIDVPKGTDWVATMGVSRYEPTARDYNSLHLVSWIDTDNNVRFTYGYGGGTRNLSITAENRQVMQSYGTALDLGGAPFQMRLVKEGTIYTGLLSTNGVDFVPVVTNTVALYDNPAKIGFWMGIDPAEWNLAEIDFFDVRATWPRLYLTVNPGSAQLQWGTVSNAVYQIQSTGNLHSWSNVGAPIIGRGGMTNAALPTGTSPMFFRLTVVQ